MSNVFRYIAHNGSAGQSFATVMTAPAGVFVAATDSDASPLVIGSDFFFGTTYDIYETFLSFDTSALGSTPGFATLTLVCSFTSGTPLTIVVAVYDWGATIGSGDWRDSAQLSGLTEAGRLVVPSPGPGDVYIIDLDPAVLVLGGNTRFVVFAENEETGVAPSGQNHIYLDGPLDASPPSLTWGAGGATVSSRSPASGATAGGTVVALGGTGFAAATDVTVDGVSVSFTIIDDSHLTFTTPAHAAGSVAVVVVVPGPDGSTDFLFSDGPAPPDVVDGCIALKAGDFLADSSTPDGDGIVYTVQSLTGWWDTPPVRSETIESFPGGEEPTVFRENARRPILTLVAHAPTAAALGPLLCWTAIANVKAAFDALFVPVLLQVSDPVNNLSGLARLAGPIRATVLGESVAVKLQVPLLLPNPTLS